MLLVGDIDLDRVRKLLDRHGVRVEQIEDGLPIPGSYWGEPEAGLIGRVVHVRADTPVHSLLHEACHLLVMPAERRDGVHTNATDSVAEEDATCYLQIVIAGALPDVGSERLMSDMDTWGYSFRLGSAQAWFEQDASDARAWLVCRGLLAEIGDHASNGRVGR